MTGKRCASCGHAEIDHVGLGCSLIGCDCRGFEAKDEDAVSVPEETMAIWTEAA